MSVVFKIIMLACALLGLALGWAIQAGRVALAEAENRHLVDQRDSARADLLKRDATINELRGLNAQMSDVVGRQNTAVQACLTDSIERTRRGDEAMAIAREGMARTQDKIATLTRQIATSGAGPGQTCERALAEMRRDLTR